MTTQKPLLLLPHRPGKIERCNDLYFKWLFLKANMHKSYLLDLLNAIFEDLESPCIEGTIEDIVIQDREIDPDAEDLKSIRLDINVFTSSGQCIDVEVYSGIEPALDARTTFYFSSLASMQLKKGATYDSLTPVIIINILARNYFSYSDGYHIRRTLCDFGHNEQCLKVNAGEYMDFRFIECQKIHSIGDKKRNRLVRWLQYFSRIFEEDFATFAESDQIFKGVLMAEQAFKANNKLMGKYYKLNQEDMERIFGYEASRSEGRKEGIEIGEKRGIEIGEKRGIEIGASREQKTIASRMLKKGKGLEEIAEDTQMSLAQLQALKLELGL